MHKIIVTQLGARHRYLIPNLLDRNGMLAALYTDSTRYSFLGRCAFLLESLGVKSVSINKLARRRPQVALHKLYSSDKLFIDKKLLLFKKKFFNIPMWKSWEQFYTSLEEMYIKWGVRNADCVYSMYFENFRFLEYAKSKGLKVVIDIFETPNQYISLIEEIKNNPEYAEFGFQIKIYECAAKMREKYVDRILALADKYTVPSQFVISNLDHYKNYNPEKVVFLPYASSITISEYNYKPIRHRLIWVGNDPVRKGILYCAKAATELKKTYPDLDFRIIGVVDERFKSNETFKDLNFIGNLGKDELMEEYRNAEAYVFPTLFEGFAGTIIEAASCGCPIITTDASGADPTEFPAMFIQRRDVAGIVNSVTDIFENSGKRDFISKAVYNYSSTLKPEVYEKNLLAIFEKLR